MIFPKRTALVPVAALVAVAVLACTGCKKPQPSILIISIDSLRADEVARVENGRPVAPAPPPRGRQSATSTSPVARPDSSRRVNAASSPVIRRSGSCSTFACRCPRRS